MIEAQVRCSARVLARHRGYLAPQYFGHQPRTNFPADLFDDQSNPLGGLITAGMAGYAI